MRGIHVRSLALLAAAGLLALACGSGGGGGGGGGSQGTIKIGVDLPMSGAESSNGVPTLNGVKFAVSQTKTIDGFTIEVDSLDDAVNGVHDPQKGAQNVQQLIADNEVIGMVGPFNSNVARAEIPITSAAHLVQVSPANTNQCLTKPVYLSPPLVPSDVSCTAAGLPAPADLRKGNPNNYFRVAATDDFQGPAGAEYATKVLHLTKIGVLSDNEVYGKGIADTFSLRFKTDGGTVVYRNDITNASKVNDFTTFLRAAKNAGAEAIYFGGTDSNNVCVARNQMKNIFPADAPFLGGDGIVTGQCLKDAGAVESAGMHGTVAAEDVSKVPDAQSVISAFKQAYPNASDYGAYTIPAYDCAKLIIAAFDRAYKANGNKKPSREQVRAAMANTKDFHGALGTYSLDSNGDITQKFITEYTTKEVNGTWEWDVDIQYDMGKILSS